MEQAHGGKDKAGVPGEAVRVQEEIVFARVAGRGYLINREFPAIQSTARNAAIR